MKRFFISVTIFLISFFAMSGSQGFCADGKGASDRLHSFIDTLKSIQFPITDPASHSAQVQRAHSALDLEAMGQKALGDHWAKMNELQQKEFMALFWKLIENIAYPRSSSFFAAAPIEYSEPKVLDKGVEISTIVKNQEDAALSAPVVYDLYEQGGQWKIYDIYLDGVSITEDLKYQFNKIIEESSYPGLLQRMRERLDKAETANQKN